MITIPIAEFKMDSVQIFACVQAIVAEHAPVASAVVPLKGVFREAAQEIAHAYPENRLRMVSVSPEDPTTAAIRPSLSVGVTAIRMIVPASPNGPVLNTGWMDHVHRLEILLARGEVPRHRVLEEQIGRANSSMSDRSIHSIALHQRSTTLPRTLSPPQTISSCLTKIAV